MTSHKSLASLYRNLTGKTTYTPHAPTDPAKLSQYHRARDDVRSSDEWRCI